MGQLKEAVRFLADRFGDAPETVFVLGSGLGEFVEDLPDTESASYQEIPHFPVSSIVGHAGRLAVARDEQQRFCALQGRVHFYEGVPMSEIVFAVRALALWGGKIFVITNAAGALNEDYAPGDLMLIRDHINLLGDNPLCGPNLDELGQRFPDMTYTYSRRLLDLGYRLALELRLSLRQGVYAAVKGPSYETPAEIQMLRGMGADAVGMSTVPEVIALNHMGKEVMGLSCISNRAAGVRDEKLDHEDVLRTVRRVKDDFRRFLLGLLRLVPLLLMSCLLLSACRSVEEPGTPPTAGGQEVDLLVTGTVITMDPDYTVYEPGYVAISDDTIVAVGPLAQDSDYPAARRLDAAGSLILPGLINGHQHAAMSLMRGMADDLRLMDWLYNYMFPAEKENVDPEFVYWGTLLSAAEMLASGTTTYADMYYFEDQVARATAEAGMRAVLGQTIIGFPAPDHASPDEALSYTEEFIRRWKDHSLVIPAVAPHAPYTCSREVLLACKELADRYDVPLLIHLAETENEVQQLVKETGFRPTQYLEEIGFLSERLIAAHVVWAQPHELDLLKLRGVGVVHNPESNMKLASGVAPVVQMLGKEMQLGLGTDGPVSNNNLDLFQEMDTMAKLHKVDSGDPTALSARQALTIATRGGAAALGLEDQIGSLEPGKRADLILVKLDSPAAFPLYDFYSTLVYSLNGSSVHTVIVNGRVIIEDRRFLHLNIGEIFRRADSYKRQVQDTLGPPLDAGQRKD